MLSLTTISYFFLKSSKPSQTLELLSKTQTLQLEHNIDLTNAIIMKLFDKIIMHHNLPLLQQSAVEMTPLLVV